MLLEEGQTLLMTGDSVTDAGRAQPVGEGLFGALGTGYPTYVRALLESAYPELHIHTINTGASGNTIRDLSARWERDVLSLSPDWITVMIGINDVWRQFDCPAMPKLHVYLPEYKDTLRRLTESTMKRASGMLLMTPYYMEPNRSDPMRACMDEYGQAVEEISLEYHTLFLNTQQLFDGLFQHMHSSNIAWDRVHPNATGHMLIARALLRQFGFDR